jgi:hypothetical protein
MKRKNWILFGILLTGLAVLFWGWQAKGAFAQNMTFEEMLNYPPNGRDVTIQSQDELPTLTSVATNENIYQPLDSNGYVTQVQIKKNEAIIEHARGLIQMANRTYGTAGWWHSSYQIYYVPSDPESSTSPSGLPMPTEWKEDHWDLVDENGLIIQSVSIQDSGDPATSQIGFYKDGVTTNLLYGMTWEEEPQPVSIGSGFLDLTVTDKSVEILEENEEMLGNQSVIVFTRKPIAAPMIVIGGQLVEANKVENPPIGSYSRSYFSKDTGLLVLYEAYSLLKDGQEKLMHRISILVYEKISEPPADVLKYLQ